MAQTVLLIEDEPWLAQAYADGLRAVGYRPVQVTSAAEAIETIDAISPHLLLLDIMLPQVNGLQLLHELRSHSDLQTVPVIVCSNVMQRYDLSQLAAYGVSKVLDKTTLTPSRLIAVVREVLA